MVRVSEWKRLEVVVPTSSNPVADLEWAAQASKHTVRASYEIARAVIAAGVPGDFVECGVFAGANSAAMARAIQYDMDERFPPYGGKTFIHLTDRRVHLFDTFTGCPAPTAPDKEWIAAAHQAGVSACSLEQMLGYMDGWKIPRELLRIHKGPFSQTIPKAVDVQQIAVLRLDADLYESTKEALALYDLLSPGGWCIVDDWALSGCRQAVEEKLGGKMGPVYWVKTE
jgi:O-methyltransferase